jgi:hypothetical protein
MKKFEIIIKFDIIDRETAYHSCHLVRTTLSSTHFWWFCPLNKRTVELMNTVGGKLLGYTGHKLGRF